MILIKSDKIPCSVKVTKSEYTLAYSDIYRVPREINVVFNRNTRSARVEPVIAHYLVKKYDFLHYVEPSDKVEEPKPIPKKPKPKVKKNDKAKPAPRNTNKSRGSRRKV